MRPLEGLLGILIFCKLVTQRVSLGEWFEPGPA